MTELPVYSIGRGRRRHIIDEETRCCLVLELARDISVSLECAARLYPTDLDNMLDVDFKEAVAASFGHLETAKRYDRLLKQWLRAAPRARRARDVMAFTKRRPGRTDVNQGVQP